MVTKFTIEQATKVAEGAFEPFVCVAELIDGNKNRLRLSVIDKAGIPVNPSIELNSGQFREPSRFKGILSEVRSMVEKRHKDVLVPWQFPEIFES